MAQGKLKVKAKKPALSNKKSNKSSGKVTKKGRKVIAPKKGVQLEIHRIQKNISKGINKNIESQIAQRAHTLEEGKAFHVVQAPKSSKKK